MEPAFEKVYKKELYEHPNIHFVGFIKLRSKRFYELISSCNFIIFPSCAEGQPGSVLECMAHGLIPILSKEANIDVKNFGVIMEKNSIDEIAKVVNYVSQKSAEWCEEKSKFALKEIAENYTPEKFLKNIKRAIITIVDSTRRSRPS